MSRYFWTQEDDALITSDALSDDELAAKLERSVTAIRQRRWKVNTGRARHDYITGRPPNVLADVWRYVDQRGPDECWPWTGAKRRRGYGAFTLGRKNLVASRAAFQAATGIDPSGNLVCHTCDNPPCCNPSHLFLGTHTDNVHDMLAKGRARPAHGERHHGAKLTVAQVREIRRRRASGEKLVDLSREFGVCDGRLSTIVNHPERHWSHA